MERITFPADMPLLSSEAPRLIGPARRTRRSTAWLPLALRRPFALLLTFALLFVSTLAGAAEWKPPPLRGHVVDEAGALAPAEARALDRKLDRARQQTGFAIVVYILPQLPEGLSIEDVGYTAGNTWGVGSKEGAEGVLLINAVAERKLRIETGKGAGGALTDLASSRISREVIGPLLKQGKTDEAMDRGTDAILQEMIANEPGGSRAGRDPSASRRGGESVHPTTPADWVKTGVAGLVLLGVIILAIVSPTFRQILFFMLLFGRGGGGRGGGGGGGGGGSGYGGGGGSFGGGGSSDDY